MDLRGAWREASLWIVCQCVYKYRLPPSKGRAHLTGLWFSGRSKAYMLFWGLERESQARQEDYTWELVWEGFGCFLLFSLMFWFLFVDSPSPS